MRLGEILKLRWKDLNLKLGTILVRAENAKSKKERVIEFGSALYEIFGEIEKRSEFVFLNPKTGKPFENNRDVERAFVETCEKAEIESGRKNGGIVFHDLRHFAARRLVQKTDVVTASKILGHSSLDMTLRYVHPTAQDKREAVEKAFEELFGDESRQPDVNRFSGESGKELEKEAQAS